MFKLNRLTVAVISTMAVGFSASPAAAASAPTYPMVAHMYGQRYCEMAVATLVPSGIHAIVYNTFGLNKCPATEWAAATTPAALLAAKTSRGVLSVTVNGPRWWAFDEIGGLLGSTVEMFGTIGTREAAVLDFSLTGLPAPFTEFPVKRTSTWIYHKGSYVRELTSPTNHHYVLQSWTTMISSKVVASKLNTLASGSKPLLTLPKGWKFKARKLTKQLVIIAPGTMTLVQDNLKGVYSKIS